MNCGHDTCRCQVGVDEQFCADHCREHAGQGEAHAQHDACECGHTACQVS